MKTEVFCAGCRSKLRIPSTGKGTIICPHCNNKLIVNGGKIISCSSSAAIKKRENKEVVNLFVRVGLIIILAILFVFFKDNAVDWYNNRDIDCPRLEFVNNNIHVYNLDYTVGLIEINKVKTNLADFNELVWDQLRGKSGIHRIIRHSKEIDKYGNRTVTEQEFGSLNLDELNKYQTFDDFKKAGGFYTLMVKP